MVVDDHFMVRDGLKQALEHSGEFEVVGLAADGDEAVLVAAEVSPDVVVMDVLMPEKDGVEACREIIERSPETKVVMLTASREDTAVIDAVAAGATGYLRKDTDRERLLSTLRSVCHGEVLVPGEVVKRVFTRIRNGAHAAGAVRADKLTAREREILVSFARGMSYAAIASARGLKTVTVRNAVYGIQSKLGVESMQGLVLWAVRNGLLDEYVEEGP